MSIILIIFILIGATFGEKQSIRIYVDDGCLDTSSPQNINDTETIKRAIEQARITLEKLVMVERLANPIDLNQYTSIIPSEFQACAAIDLRGRIDCDLFIFIRYAIGSEGDSMNFPKTNIISYVDNDQTKRPLIGTIIHRYNLNDNDDAKIHGLSVLFLHQFTHILGFRKTILLNKGILKTEMLGDRMNNVPRQRTFINGTKALKVARDYFNCSSIDGIEIDDSTGEDGEDNIHWHGRILLGDYLDFIMWIKQFQKLL